MDDALKRLVVHEPGSPAVEAVWPHLFRLDPEGRLLTRRRQRAELGRYLRQDVHQWDDVEVVELEGYYADMVDILKGEGGSAREVEDGGG